MAKSYQELINQALQILSGESAKLEAEILLAHAVKKPRSHLLAWPDKQSTPTQATFFLDLVKRRAAGEPVAYILGKQEFWGLDFKVTPETLIPRADTETLIEEILALVAYHQADSPNTSNKANPTLLDLGTGSGAIAISLKHSLPQLEVCALDSSAAALEVAQENAQAHEAAITFYQGSWYQPLTQEKFDFIVSNPPYIEKTDSHLTDLKYEPIAALVADNQGLSDLETIISQAQSWLNPQGWLLVEHGYNQAEQVADIFNSNNFQQVKLRYDLGKNPRVTLGQKPL